MDLSTLLASLKDAQASPDLNSIPSLDDKDNAFFQQELANSPAASSSPPTSVSSATDDEDDSEDDAPESPPSPVTPSPASEMPPPSTNGAAAAAPSSYDVVKSMLMQKYGIGGSGQDSDALKAAQSQAAENSKQALLGHAFGTLINGMSGGNAPVDSAFYDNLRKQAQTPVTNLLQQRALGEENLKNAKSVEDLTKETIGNDPNAPINQNFRALLSKVPSLKGVDLSSVTVSNAGPFQKVADAMIAADAKKAMLQQARDNHQAALDMRQDRMDQMVHQRNLMAIKRDPNLRNRMQQYQNLDNAMNLITQAKKLTPQQIDDFQQAVRANLGIKGSSGVDERGRTYINTLGLNSARFGQLLTGNPADLAKNSALMEHLRDLAINEQKNIQSQYLNSLKAAGAGNASLYSRRADLRADLDGLFQANQNQLSSVVGGANTAPQQAPQTKVVHGITYHKVDGGWQAD